MVVRWLRRTCLRIQAIEAVIVLCSPRVGMPRCGVPARNGRNEVTAMLEHECCAASRRGHRSATTLPNQTAGNIIIGDVIARIHDNVKKGGSRAEPLKESAMFLPLIRIIGDPAVIGGDATGG